MPLSFRSVGRVQR